MMDHTKSSDERSIWFHFLHDDKGIQSKVIKAAGGSTRAMHNHLKTVII